VTIPDEEQDRDLAQKLQEELPGILAWAVQGCLQWQKEGLVAPAQVAEATKSYREEMDILGGFLEEKCVINKLVEAKAKDLYHAYLEWCEEVGEKPTSQRRFGMALTERGFERKKVHGTYVYSGIGLIAGEEGWLSEANTGKLHEKDEKQSSPRSPDLERGNTLEKRMGDEGDDRGPFSKKSLYKKNKKKVIEKRSLSSPLSPARNGRTFAEPGFGDEGGLSSSPDRPYTQAPDNEDLPPF
jgi:putative DNA primase/helicase